MTRTNRPRHVNDHVMARFQHEDIPVIDGHVLWCERRALSTKTIYHKVTTMASLAETHPNTSLLDLTGDQIEKHLDGLRGHAGGPIQSNTRKARVSIFRTFYRWAVEFDHLDLSPMRQVITPKVSPSLPSPISENDYRLALASAPTELMRLWVLLSGAGSLRVGEIAGLCWSGVDLYDRTMRVTGKGGRTRVVPLIDDIVDMLHDRQRTRGESDHVFTDPVFGRPYAAAKVSSLIVQFLRELGLDCRAHSLRHRFGTEACESSGDIRAVQELMGHASIETTAMYTLVRSKRKRGVIDGMRDAA